MPICVCTLVQNFEDGFGSARGVLCLKRPIANEDVGFLKNWGFQINISQTGVYVVPLKFECKKLEAGVFEIEIIHSFKSV